MTKPKTRAPWTEAEDAYIRETMAQPAAAVADTLKRTRASIYTRRSALRAQDEADAYMHVDHAPTTRDIPTTRGATPKPNPKPKPLDLSGFDLFDPVTGDDYRRENPSLLRRLWRWITRQA